MERKLIEAIATLVGLTIGAGILGIPYVVAQAGFLTGVFIILFLGLIIVLMNLYVGEITLRTKGTHQLPGYVEKYLGKKGKFFMMISLMITVYGALTGYIIGEGVAWAAILNISPLYPMLIFFALMAIIVFRGLKLIKNNDSHKCKEYEHGIKWRNVKDCCPCHTFTNNIACQCSIDCNHQRNHHKKFSFFPKIFFYISRKLVRPFCSQCYLSNIQIH